MTCTFDDDPIQSDNDRYMNDFEQNMREKINVVDDSSGSFFSRVQIDSDPWCRR